MLLGLGLGLILCGGLAAVALDRPSALGDRVFAWCVVLGCLLALIPPSSELIAATTGMQVPVALTGPPGVPFGIDLLSAWFLLVVLGVGGTIAAYGVPYLGRERGHRNVGVAHLLLAVLIVALAGVVTARTVVAFLVCWEIMALGAWFLVIFEHERREVWSAGMVYLILTHIGTLALIGMFAVWCRGDTSWSFEELARASLQGLAASSVVLTLGLIGFGIKAGVVPVHFWLPGAHAAAPSHVSALLSGVMLKVGIYGLFRILTLTGPPPLWWGWTVLVLGLVSAVLGVLWALAQHDIKRLLAYHSVENIGIILMGLGLGALGTAYGQPAVALLGYTGALLHTLNHALFKSLLFLGAGAVVRATGTREIDRLGGLARSMPRTALLFLVGSAAIVGLPPLNGFVSEWLIFRGLVGAGNTTGSFRVASVTVVGLALTGALALACFSKLYGTVFAGTARDPAAVPDHPEVSPLLASQWVLAAFCVLIGVAPTLVLPATMMAAGLMIPGRIPAIDGALAIDGARSLSALAAGLIALAVLVWAARAMTLARRTRASAATWSCAFAGVTSRMQYTASSYASPLLSAFGPVSGSQEQRTPGSFHSHPSEPVLDLLGRPIWRRLRDAATRLRPLQSGGMRSYLIYVILCLLALLVYLGAGR